MNTPTPPLRLETPRLVLRELEEADAPAAHAYEQKPEVVRYVMHDVRTLEESLAYIRSVRETVHAVPRTTFDLAAALREDGRYLGRVGLKVTNVEQREAMLWYIFDPAHWGKGYAPEASRALLEFGFERLGLHRIFIDIDPRNRASARVGEKLGMRFEGHFVENVWVKGEWADTGIYAMLEREWRERRERSR